jgi:hypothetical protein
MTKWADFGQEKKRRKKKKKKKNKAETTLWGKK